MNNLLIHALAQMIAPKLFRLSGDEPDEMGFPFAENKQAFEQRMERQFSPVKFWTDKATEMATAIIDTLESGGELSLDIEKVVARSAHYAAAWQEDTQ